MIFEDRDTRMDAPSAPRGSRRVLVRRPSNSQRKRESANCRIWRNAHPLSESELEHCIAVFCRRGHAGTAPHGAMRAVPSRSITRQTDAKIDAERFALRLPCAAILAKSGCASSCRALSHRLIAMADLDPDFCERKPRSEVDDDSPELIHRDVAIGQGTPPRLT